MKGRESRKGEWGEEREREGERVGCEREGESVGLREWGGRVCCMRGKERVRCGTVRGRGSVGCKCGRKWGV